MKCGILITLLILIGAQTHATEPIQDRWWDLVPAAKSHFGGGHIPEKATDDEVEALSKKEFKTWVDYEDEFVKFSYPEHPHIKFSIQKPKQNLTVEGGVCTTVDNSFQQAYVLKVGDTTYGVFLLNPSKWLDDGICLCGPMVYHAYRLENGTVTRFSMLPGGAVKKAQVVGGGIRFMSFEWTHLACPREVYEKMVSSMQIKTREEGGDQALKEKLIKKYGREAEVELLHRGDSIVKIITLLGQAKENQKDPENADAHLWTWKWDGENYPCTLVARTKNNKLVNFPSHGIERDHNNPIHGSHAWVSKFLDDRANDDEDKAKLHPPKQEQKKLIVQQISQTLDDGLADYQANPAEPAPIEWLIALDLAKTAHTVGIHSTEWDKLVLKHGKGIPQECDYLTEAKAIGTDKWLLKCLKNPPVDDPRMMMIDDVNNTDLLLISLHDNYPLVFANQAEALWNIGNPDLQAAMLRSDFDFGLSEETALSWGFDALNLSVKEKHNGLTMAVMSFLSNFTPDEIDQDKRSKILSLIKKLPMGEKGSEWSSARETILKLYSK